MAKTKGKHHKDCGDVGDVGEIGELGTNASDSKEGTAQRKSRGKKEEELAKEEESAS